MILQTTNNIDYFLITVLLSPVVIFLLIKLLLHIFNKKHLNKRLVSNLLHFVFAIIISALIFYAYDSLGVHIAKQYISDQKIYYSSSEVNKNNYTKCPWKRKLVQHDGMYGIDETLTYESNGNIILYNIGIKTDNWFVLKHLFNLDDGKGRNTYSPIYDSLYVSSEHNLFGDTVYFFYNDSLKVIETNLLY